MAVYTERGSAGNAIYKLEWSATNLRVRFTHRNDGGSLSTPDSATTASLGDGKPHVIGFSKATTAVRFFRDGIVDGTATLGQDDTLTAASAECRIGADKGDATAYFRHWIGFVALWNRTISDTEAIYLSTYALNG
jgi:hypothetical protein